MKYKLSEIIVLGLSSVLHSKLFFSFINDPEGPNLLIVTALASVIYAVSLLMYFFFLSKVHKGKILLVILMQFLLILILYFFLK